MRPCPARRAWARPLRHSRAGALMGVDLPLIWAVIILFGIMMYVVMDGFDLGNRNSLSFSAGKEDRDVMMNTVAPVWDGNETGSVASRSCSPPSRSPMR